MAEWIFSSSVLMLIVIALRHILHGKVRPGIQYTLWGLVLLRLLIPMSIFASPISVMNIAGKVEQLPLYTSASDTLEETQVYSDRISNTAMTPDEARSAGTGTLHEIQGYAVQSGSANLRSYLFTDSLRNVLDRLIRLIWMIGTAAILIWFILSNLLFRHGLTKNCVRLRIDRTIVAGMAESIRSGRSVPVYMAENLRSPCLFGLFRPAVYVTPEVAGNHSALCHVMMHEISHYAHRDHIWSLLRAAAIALHWYNPLVWRAASLSRRDAELFADAGALARLGDDLRISYGETLVGLATQRTSVTELLRCATTMTGGRSGIAERVMMIARKPRMTAYTVIAVALIAAVAVGCTFTGATNQAEQNSPTQAPKAQGSAAPSDLTGAQPNADETWTEEEIETWDSEVNLFDFAVMAEDPNDYNAVANAWAEMYLRQYMENASETNPVRSTETAVLKNEIYAESLFAQPKHIVLDVRFACNAADAKAFERKFVGWAGPLGWDEYPQYEGWMAFSWYIELSRSETGAWRCVDAGTGGYGSYGYLNYNSREHIDEILPAQMEIIQSGDEGTDSPSADLLLRILPFIDWAKLYDQWGTAGTNAVWATLDKVCITEGRYSDPESKTLWSDVYPDDQAYRNLYVMKALQNADQGTTSGFASILKKQYEYDKNIFALCLGQLNEGERKAVEAALQTVNVEPGPAKSRRNFTIKLDTSKPRIQLTIKLDGEIAFDKEVETASGSITIPLIGSGRTWMDVYFDMRLTGANEITFE